MAASKEEILQRVDETKDRLQDLPEKSLKWQDVERMLFPYAHPRPLPRDTAEKAINYIKAIVRDYPFQLQYTMALPYWERFSQVWCESGDEDKSMREI
jgi:hypothetical protein